MFGRFSFLFFSLLFGIVQSLCPNGSHEWKSNCYFFNATASGFAKAELSCIKIEGHLAAIHDAFTNDIIGQNAPNYFGQNAMPDFWIGLNALSTPNLWEWTDGSDFGFQDWNRGQPSNKSSRLNCAAMALSNGRWSSADCFKLKPYVCAVPNGISSTILPTPTTTKIMPTTTSTSLPSTPATMANCSDGWVYFEPMQSCYGIFYDEDRDFQTSENFCQSFGAHLSSIHSQAEMQLLVGYGIKYCHAFWLGLFTADNGTTWQWTDGTPFDFVNWWPGHPEPGLNCANEDFTCSEGSQGQFYTDDCTSKWATTCKKGRNM